MDKDSFSLRYSTIDDAIAICNLLGPGTLLAKIDLQDAFQMCPVRPEDPLLLPQMPPVRPALIYLPI